MFDSPVDMTGNSSGRPPDSQTPRLTCSAIVRRCALHGVSSDQVLQMPTTGRPSKTSAGSPWFLIQLRWMNPSLSCFPNQAADRYVRLLVTPDGAKPSTLPAAIYSRAMTPAPSRVRHAVTAFAVALAVVTYVDRVAISVAAPFISADLGLSKPQMAWALAAFGWAYAVFEIPGGWLGDKIGPRRV